MSCDGEIEAWKVDRVGKFFGVKAGHEGVGGGDEGIVEGEKRTNHNTIGRVDEEYNMLPNAGVKGEIVMGTGLAASVLCSCDADEESLILEQSGVLRKDEEMAKKAISGEDSNNNKCFEKFVVPKYQANESAEEIIDMVLDIVFNSELPAKKDDLTVLTDASHVTFACQDVRLKPGFVMPVKVEKPKIVAERKVVVDNFYDYLAYPGECVIIPDVAEETWRDATDKELGQELADKLKEDKVDVIVSLVDKFGRNVVLDYFWETQKIEESGGLMIMNGARRRSSGGVLFHLLRETKDEKIRLKVQEFFKERQTSDSRGKKAVADLKKKKMEKEVKEFIQERSEKDLMKKCNVVQQEEVFDINALFE